MIQKKEKKIYICFNFIILILFILIYIDVVIYVFYIYIGNTTRFREYEIKCGEQTIFLLWNFIEVSRNKYIVLLLNN